LNLKSPELKFLITFIPLITIWYFTYHYLYKIDVLLNLDSDLLTAFSKILSSQSNFILSIFNFQTSSEIQGNIVVAKIIGFPYSHGVWIGEPCNGIKVFGLFAIFILSFKGNSIRKIIFITIGILIIHFLNIVRIALLTYISAVNPYILDFNHNVTFQLLIYGSMLALWYAWIIKFSKVKPHEN